MSGIAEKNHVVVDCGHCDATVKAEVLAIHKVNYFDDRVMVELPDHRVSLAVCPACQEAVVARETEPVNEMRHARLRN